MTDDCKKCGKIYDVRWDDESTGYCDACAQDRVAELEARERLVQDVIQLSNQIEDGKSSPIELRRKARKLAEWKP